MKRYLCFLLKIINLDATVMLPEYDYIYTMLDKWTSVNAISKTGIDSPKTILVADFLREKSFIFPCIAKPRSGRGSRNVKILNQPSQVLAYLSLTELREDEVVLQEFFSGEEYTVLMSADRDQNLKAIIPVLVKIKRAITLRAEIVRNETVIDACKAIHNAIPTSGCYNIQLILTDNRRVIPFEINPRISTTFCLGLATGVDPIAIFSGDEYESLGCIGNKLQRNWVNNLFF